MNIEYKRPAPSVTLVLVCYNQEKYIKEAVLSALHQDYSPLKIIISDDCSKDNTVSIIEDILKTYNGPHEVFFNKNTINQGLIKHINLVNSLVDTELLVVAAGDDISYQNRVTETIEAYRLAEQQPTSIYSSVNRISPDGKIIDTYFPPIEKSPHSILDISLSDELIIGASHAWHKSLFTIFGDIKELGAYEDLVLAYRSSILNGLLYIDKPLVNYRVDIGMSSPQFSGVSRKDRRRERLTYINKHMIPVLAQRLIDTQYIESNDIKTSITKMLNNSINRLKTIDAFLKNKVDKQTFISAIHHGNLGIFIKYMIYKKIDKI